MGGDSHFERWSKAIDESSSILKERHHIKLTDEALVRIAAVEAAARRLGEMVDSIRDLADASHSDALNERLTMQDVAARLRQIMDLCEVEG